MNKIIPHLWFDNEALQAAEFYSAVFPNTRVTSKTTLGGVPSPTGECMVVCFEIDGSPFMAISAGPLFKPNSSISFFLNFDPARDAQARTHLDEVWEKLTDDGKVLMPLQEYSFSKHYGWVEDKYGVSWQLILSEPEGEPRPFVVPSLLFVGDVCGKAEDAVKFYRSIFKDSETGLVARYPTGMEPDKEGSIMYSDFRLLDTWFAAMDSAHEHKFAFNEAISLLVSCETQEEIDYYWEKLSAVPEAEQCGWLKDKFGVSWQISAAEIDAVMKTGTREQIDSITQAFLPMKKLDIAVLRHAYAGKGNKD